MHTFIVYRKQKTEQYLAFGISAIVLEIFNFFSKSFLDRKNENTPKFPSIEIWY